MIPPISDSRVTRQCDAAFWRWQAQHQGSQKRQERQSLPARRRQLRSRRQARCSRATASISSAGTELLRRMWQQRRNRSTATPCRPTHQRTQAEGNITLKKQMARCASVISSRTVVTNLTTNGSFEDPSAMGRSRAARTRWHPWKEMGLVALTPMPMTAITVAAAASQERAAGCADRDAGKKLAGKPSKHTARRL